MSEECAHSAESGAGRRVRLIPVMECHAQGKPPQTGPHAPHHWLRRSGPMRFWRWRYCPGAEEDYGPGCACTELCEMGPTCPGGMLAGLPGSGCHRVTPPADPCRQCGPGYRIGDDGCRHTSPGRGALLNEENPDD